MARKTVLEKATERWTFGQVLKRLREALGLSCAEFAKETGLSARFIFQCEENMRRPSVKSFARMAKVLKVPVPLLEWFLFEPTAKGLHDDLFWQAEKLMQRQVNLFVKALKEERGK